MKYSRKITSVNFAWTYCKCIGIVWQHIGYKHHKLRFALVLVSFCVIYCLLENTNASKICTLDWSLFHKNHHIQLPCCSGKDFSTLKLWKLSDFKNLKNSEPPSWSKLGLSATQGQKMKVSKIKFVSNITFQEHYQDKHIQI